jgi:thiol:disulfide interchange protein DsbD
MSIVYSFLGVAAGISGKVFGSFTNTGGWYVALGVIMSLAALMMLDVIVFDPQAWLARLKKSHAHTHSSDKTSTLLGVFTLGLTSGFVAAPCTTPVFGAILGYIARTHSVELGLLLMLAFSFGLGTLLVLVALFTGTLQFLPRSGNWMKWIKIASGVLLLAFAHWLFYRAGAHA